MTEKQSRRRNKHGFSSGFIKEAEDMALEIREQLKVSKFAALNAFDVAKKKEIPIFTFDEILYGDIYSAKREQLHNDSNVSALYTINKEGRYIILHKNINSAEREQSNIMHEIAHILLKHKVPEEFQRLVSLFQIPYDNKVQEAEAKYLGSCLQLPKPVLFLAKKMKWTEEEISKKYFASIEMIRYRMDISGVNIITKRKEAKGS
jgi:Zn-dependent peptidase ImmA (M78 family)